MDVSGYGVIEVLSQCFPEETENATKFKTDVFWIVSVEHYCYTNLLIVSFVHSGHYIGIKQVFVCRSTCINIYIFIATSSW